MSVYEAHSRVDTWNALTWTYVELAAVVTYAGATAHYAAAVEVQWTEVKSMKMMLADCLGTDPW